MRRWLGLAILGLSSAAYAQIDAINGLCTQGGVSATVQGLNSTNKLDGIIPKCTVTVFLTGTTTKATIFSNSLGTPLTNPFTANALGSAAPGQWLFYAADGVGYDVTMSGGVSPLVYTLPVTLTDVKVGGGGGGGGVSSFSSGNLLPLFTTNVANPTTSPALSFNPQSVPNLSFYGNVTPTINPPQFVTFVAGTGITFTPAGGTSLTISAASGAGCAGPLISDVTSTVCGTNNLTTPPAGPAFLQAFGDNQLNTVTGTHMVAVGNGNGNLFPNREFIGIGDTNGASVPSSSPQSNDVIGVGNNNIATVVGSIPDLICIGDANCQTISWLQDSVGIGNANFQNNIGTNASTFLSEAIGIGLGNIEFVNNGSSVIGIGQAAAGGCGPAQGDFCTGQTGSNNVSEVISMGDASGNTIGSNVDDVILIGDGVMDSVAPSSSDIIGIGDAALQECEISGLSSCASLSIPTPTAMSEVIGIGTLAGAFDQGSNIIAIGLRTVGGGGSAAPTHGNSGTFNVGVGDNALAKNTTGSNNVGIGPYAGADGYVFPSTFGNSNLTGSNNTWLGYDSGPNTTTQLTNTIAVGYQAHNTVSNQTVIGNSSITAARFFGTGVGCLAADASGNITGSGSSCGAGGGGASNVTVNGGSTLATANFNGSTPAAGANGINATVQVSGASVSMEIVGDGNASHFLNGTGVFSAPAGSGTVTNIATSSPLGGGPITTTGTLTCATCIVSASPPAGIGHFAGGTQTVTSSAVSLTADVSGILPIANGGTGTASPALVAGTNVTITGTWPNNTINATGGGSSGISGLTAGVVPLAGSPTTITANSHLDEITTAGVDTFTQPVAITGATHGMSIPAGTAVAGAANTVIYASDATSGFAEVNENNTGLARICTSANSVCTGGGGSATVASAEVVSFSATPTFSTAFNVSRIVLTNNITSFTLAAGSDGQDKKLCFKQGSGPFTVIPPANVHGFFTIGTVNAQWSCQSFVYDNTDSIWLADSPGVVSQ